MTCVQRETGYNKVTTEADIRLVIPICHFKEVIVMAFLDSLKEKAVDLAQAGATKSKQVAEIVKLKTANLSEEDTIKKAYMELGKLYYAERGEAPEAAYISGCERITAAQSRH